MQIAHIKRVRIAADRLAVPWHDFRLILAGGLALAVLMALEQWLWFLAPLRLALGLVYVLYVPGYCLQAALFPRADDLDEIERAGLSTGLSVAVVPVVALALDRLPWGLRPWPILLGELGATLLFMAVALWRRARLPAEEVYAPRPAWRPRAWWRGLPPPERRLYRLLGAVLLMVVLAAGWVFLVPAPDEFMTEFYILGKGGMAEEYPREAAVGEELTVTMGVVNRERGERSYRVEVWAADPWTPERRELVATAGPITLRPGHSREWPIGWRMPWAGEDQEVEFLLFTGDEPEPYRRLRLVLNVVEPSPGDVIR